MGSTHWLLVDALDPAMLRIVMVGRSRKPRVGFGSFFRGSADRHQIASLADRAATLGMPGLVRLGARLALAEPVFGPSGKVHGLWLRVAHPNAQGEPRPSIRAFEFDLVADRARASSGNAAPAGPAVSIAESLENLDFGAQTSLVLADLLAAPNGAERESTVLRSGRSGRRQVGYVTRVSVADGSRRVVRGLSFDLGPIAATSNPPRSAGELIAESTQAAGVYRAIVDLSTLELLYWYGHAPADIAWRFGQRDSRRERLHPDDIAAAEELAAELSSPGCQPRQTETRLRFWTSSGVYQAFAVLAHRVELDGNVVAALVVLRRLA